MAFQYSSLEAGQIRLIQVLPECSNSAGHIECSIETVTFSRPPRDNALFCSSCGEPRRNSQATSGQLRDYTDWSLPEIELASLALQAASARTETMPCLDCKHFEEEREAFDKNPVYAALSYTWGNQARYRPILLNGRELLVTPNLEAFLRQARAVASTARGLEPLWIDAISIDQGNLKERGEQVSYMRWIYQCAASIVIWLGDLTCTMERYFEEIRVSTMSTAHKHQSQPQPPTEFLDHPYWRRIWILQEITSPVDARSIEIWCGPASVSLEAVVGPLDQYRVRGEHEPSTTSRMQTILGPILKIRHQRMAAYTGGLSVHGLLRQLLHWHASDGRDMLFAPLQLCTKGDQFKPDYTLSEEQVFTKFAVHLIKQDGNLDVLAYAGIGRPELFSWVPDWTAKDRYDVLDCLPGRPLLADAGLKDGISLHSSAGMVQLDISGFRVGRIVGVSKTVSDTRALRGLWTPPTFMEHSEHDVDPWPWVQPSSPWVYDSIRATRQSPRLQGSSLSAWLRAHHLQAFSTEIVGAPWAGAYAPLCPKFVFAPGSAKPGDLICVILGARTPVLLREIYPDGSKKMFKFVGQCVTEHLGSGLGILSTVQEIFSKELLLTPAMDKEDTRSIPVDLREGAQDALKELRHCLIKLVSRGIKLSDSWYGEALKQRLADYGIDILSYTQTFSLV